jgi:hypothetical protein
MAGRLGVEALGQRYSTQGTHDSSLDNSKCPAAQKNCPRRSPTWDCRRTDMHDLALREIERRHIAASFSHASNLFGSLRIRRDSCSNRQLGQSLCVPSRARSPILCRSTAPTTATNRMISRVPNARGMVMGLAGSAFVIDTSIRRTLLGKSVEIAVRTAALAPMAYGRSSRIDRDWTSSLAKSRYARLGKKSLEMGCE